MVISKLKSILRRIVLKGPGKSTALNGNSHNRSAVRSYNRTKNVFILFIFLIMIIGFNGKILLDWKEATTTTLSTSDRIDLFRTSEYINNNIESDAIVGTFNAGIVGYFSNRTIINLDGLVNNEALEALEQKRLFQYILDENISYLADHHDVVINFLNKYSASIDIETDIELQYLMNATNPKEKDMAIFKVNP
jgi:hypothetical protein